jgi:serine/threonine-protein kinase RsbW
VPERASAAEHHERPEFVHRIWPADIRQLALIRAEVRRWLATHSLTAEAQQDLVLAVSEAATNAAQHAYRPATADDTIEITFWTEPDAVCIEIADHGAWRPPSPPPARRLGIALMQRLIQSVVIHYDRRGTRVLLRHPLPGEARTLPRSDDPTSLQVPHHHTAARPPDPGCR